MRSLTVFAMTASKLSGHSEQSDESLKFYRTTMILIENQTRYNQKKAINNNNSWLFITYKGSGYLFSTTIKAPLYPKFLSFSRATSADSRETKSPTKYLFTPL